MCSAILGVAAGMLGAGAQAASQDRDLGWTSFEVPGSPLRFDYPSLVFSKASGNVAEAPDAVSRLRAGRVFTTEDERARLQVGAFSNADKMTIKSLRARALETSYAGVDIEYDRATSSWFVLSGVRDGEMFYERVTLTCGAKRIDIWTMSYPVAERALFDRLVEEMARRYRPALRQVPCG